MSGKAFTMKHINSLHEAIEAVARNSIRHIAETYVINTGLVYSTLSFSLYLKKCQQGRY